MRQRSVQAYLYDILEACDLLAEFAKDRDFASYVADAMLRSAVERQFEIIGEALNQALAVDPGLRGRISHAKQIVAFRNRLIHGYAFVSDQMVWSILETDLPVLRREAADLLEALSGPVA
ncbi:MAG: DUF86 domain-containing protein [Armatimonadetes bacterium]|nr:DUF86 domain-containing protein [Armatimonadota bacterium]